MSTTKREILLVQLGTPQTPDAQGVRNFLREFLSDPAVVSLPMWIWKPILNLLVLPLRSSRVAGLYQKVWLPGGSPLRVYTEQLAQGLQDLFNASPHPATVRFAFSYSTPHLQTALQDGLQRFKNGEISHCEIVPLYPQYSTSTTKAVWNVVDAFEKQLTAPSPFKRFGSFYDHPLYIESLAAQIRREEAAGHVPEKYLFSFHSLPERRVKQGDPYVQHCEATAHAVAKALNWSSDQWGISFQSKFGFDPWVGPATIEVLQSWAKQGIHSVSISAPSFVADCLETLEELAIQNREAYLEAGGKNFYFIPALNADPFWIQNFFKMLNESH